MIFGMNVFSIINSAIKHFSTIQTYKRCSLSQNMLFSLKNAYYCSWKFRITVISWEKNKLKRTEFVVGDFGNIRWFFFFFLAFVTHCYGVYLYHLLSAHNTFYIGHTVGQALQFCFSTCFASILTLTVQTSFKTFFTLSSHLNFDRSLDLIS